MLKHVRKSTWQGRYHHKSDTGVLQSSRHNWNFCKLQVDSNQINPDANFTLSTVHRIKYDVSDDCFNQSGIVNNANFGSFEKPSEILQYLNKKNQLNLYVLFYLLL